jgi:5-methylcytosine-specific restriction endonuclease McrA
MRERYYCYTCRVPFEKPRSCGYCPPCWRAYNAERRKNPIHAQAGRDAVRRYREVHREELLAREELKRRATGVGPRAQHPEKRKAWLEAHRASRWWLDPEVSARNKRAQKLRRERDPEAYYTQKRAHDLARYARDREKRITVSMQVRAKRAEAQGSHSVAEWKSVLRHFGRRCVYCNTQLTPKNVSRDHKIPLSRGGTNNIQNIVPACRRCNSRKHDRTFEEFGKVLQ